MIRVLITGEKSYIGSNLRTWLNQWPDKYDVDCISLKNEGWRESNFSEYDVLFHVAALVHTGETKKNSNDFYRINRDLTFEVAQKAKDEGVKQFIFLSTMGVYGKSTGIITGDTIPSPRAGYEKSKLQAEKLLNTLEASDFKVAILRTPTVYGKGCKGNYPKVANFAKKAPLFPNIRNKRSMIYIGNLCEFIRLIIDDCNGGLFFPQNEEYICISEMVKHIAITHGRRIRLIKAFNVLVGLLNKNIADKVFGDLVYEKELSRYTRGYNIYNFDESISLTEKGVSK